MENTNSRLSAEEIIDSYSKKMSKTNLTVVIVGGKTFKIKSIFSWARHQKVVYDPERKLHIGDYVDSYYCNTLNELEQIIDYLSNESLLCRTDIAREDVLVQEDTKRYFYLDDEINEIDYE